MFVGQWNENITYNKGDIVYTGRNGHYFVCSVEHFSDNTTYPTEDDMYWVLIHNDFLQNNELFWGEDAGVLFSSVNQLNSVGRKRNRVGSVSDTIKYFTDGERVPIITLHREEETRQRKSVKRKLQNEEKSIKEYKKRKTQNSVEDLREKLLLLDVDIATKSFIVDKYDNLQTMHGSEYAKGVNWLKTVSSIPYGRHKLMKVKIGDSPETIDEFFKHVKSTLDKSIFGLEDVKQEILEYVARKVSNPDGKGEVLALCGSAGCGKTRLLKSLTEALDLPFLQINCGGLNDVTVITGHSETYVGSKPGKIVEFLQNSQFMNPVIYLDEIDKLGERKSEEINGVLTHLLDEEQNNSFQDNYLSNIPIDLSKVMFVIAFNNLNKVDSIVSDRMKIIHIEKPSLNAKVTICTEKLIPEIISNINKEINVNINKEVVEYIVLHKCDQEVGVRQLRKTLEKVVNRLNFDVLKRTVPEHCIETLPGEDGEIMVVYNITKKYVDNVIKSEKEDKSFLSMYM